MNIILLYIYYKMVISVGLFILLSILVLWFVLSKYIIGILYTVVPNTKHNESHNL